jgi:hypothetical protein
VYRQLEMRIRMTWFLLASVLSALPADAQKSPAADDVSTYLRHYVGLSVEQMGALRSGKAVSKALPSRVPDEVFVFGAVYVNAPSEAYLSLVNDFERLRSVPGYLAIRKFSSPAQLSDLDGFAFDHEDIEALNKCTAGDCDVQMPEGSMRKFRESVDWSAPNAALQGNQLLRKGVLARLGAYQQEGNAALGVYNDKENPTDVAGQFQYILSYVSVLPEHHPDFHQYLLSYPRGRPANVSDVFYWEKVKFGLKPTLRVIHMVMQSRNTANGRECVIAQKQLYASHYFQTALDLTFCIPEPLGAAHGFYLIKVMGSEQAGLTGLKGSMVRKAAVGRSVSSLQKSLAALKVVLEHKG